MKYPILLLLFLLLSMGVSAQLEDESNIPMIDDSEFFVHFPGGDTEFLKFMSQNIVYPEVSRLAGIQGTVYASFFVDEKGMISQITIVKGLSPEIDAEVKRVLAMMPPWKWDNGVRPSLVKKMVPVKFWLKD